MEFSFDKIKQFKFPLFFILLFVFLNSCSQNLPETKNVTSTMILDYKDEDSLPDTHLSFFVETNSNVTRADSIEIYSIKYDYRWKADDLIKIANNKRQWAGYSNFAIPEKLSKPDGNFIVKYIHADGEEREMNTYVSFNSKLYSAKATEIPEMMAEIKGRNYIAVFDKDGNLIIYGDKTKDLRNEESILKKYKDAFYTRDLWISNNSSILCLMPEVFLNKS